MDTNDLVMPCTEFNVKLLDPGIGERVYQGKQHMTVTDRSSLHIEGEKPTKG